MVSIRQTFAPPCKDGHAWFTMVKPLKLKNNVEAKRNEHVANIEAHCKLHYNRAYYSTGQTPFFAMFGQEATLPVYWIYP